MRGLKKVLYFGVGFSVAVVAFYLCRRGRLDKDTGFDTYDWDEDDWDDGFDVPEDLPDEEDDLEAGK